MRWTTMKNWAKEHKSEIAIAAIGVGATIAVVVVFNGKLHVLETQYSSILKENNELRKAYQILSDRYNLRDEHVRKTITTLLDENRWLRGERQRLLDLCDLKDEHAKKMMSELLRKRSSMGGRYMADLREYLKSVAA